MERYKLFKPTYRVRASGERKQAAKWYVEFRYPDDRERRWPLSEDDDYARRMAEQIMGLVDARRMAWPLTDAQFDFIDNAPESLRAKLLESGIIEDRQLRRGGILRLRLEGEFDYGDTLISPGYRQELLAKGDTPKYVEQTVGRIRRILKGCGLVTTADLTQAGVLVRIGHWLGDRRAKGEMNGTTMNQHIQCLKDFGAWLATNHYIRANPFTPLKKVNAETDRKQRRELALEEVRLLLAAAAEGVVSFRLSGVERELLYRFCFETGLRPGQVRCLTRGSFQLDADPPTVTSHARTVKGRKKHEQVLSERMAAELRELLANKLPTARAFAMPYQDSMADMLRRDLKVARDKWIQAAAADPQEHRRRMESDFLCETDHQGRFVDFYSLRHSHGTTLADLGVPQKDIQASMHHSNSATTERYMHTRRKSLAQTLGKIPDLRPQKAVATGTDGKPADNVRSPVSRPRTKRACATACAPTRPDAPDGDPSPDADPDPQPLPEAQKAVSDSPDAPDERGKNNSQRASCPPAYSENPSDKPSDPEGEPDCLPRCLPAACGATAQPADIRLQTHNPLSEGENFPQKQSDSEGTPLPLTPALTPACAETALVDTSVVSTNQLHVPESPPDEFLALWAQLDPERRRALLSIALSVPRLPAGVLSLIEQLAAATAGKGEE